MKKELTEKNIRANLKKEFGTKPFRLGIIAVFAGLIVSTLCFGTGRLPGTLVGLIVLVIGIIETAKSTRFKQKIDRLPLTVKKTSALRNESVPVPVEPNDISTLRKTNPILPPHRISSSGKKQNPETNSTWSI